MKEIWTMHTKLWKSPQKLIKYNLKTQQPTILDSLTENKTKQSSSPQNPQLRSWIMCSVHAVIFFPLGSLD